MKKFIIITMIAAGVSGLLLTSTYAQNNGAFFDDNMMIAQNTCPYGNTGQGGQRMMKNRNKNRSNNSYKNMNSNSNFKNQNMNKNGKGYGPKDGTGNKGVRPLDGTGYGAKNNQ